MIEDLRRNMVKNRLILTLTLNHSDLLLTELRAPREEIEGYN